MENKSESLGSKSAKILNRSLLAKQKFLFLLGIVLTQQKDPIKCLFMEGPNKLILGVFFYYCNS